MHDYEDGLHELVGEFKYRALMDRLYTFSEVLANLEKGKAPDDVKRSVIRELAHCGIELATFQQYRQDHDKA